MTARIAKGGSGRAPARGKARQRGAVRRVDTRRKKKSGLIDGFGFAPGTGRLVTGWVVAGMVAMAALAAAAAYQLPQLAAATLGDAIGEAGFTMRRVEIRGAERVSRLDILNVAFDQPSMAMPRLDLEETRARLLRFGWIKEARVHRRLPDTLVIDIVERVPAAVWQNEGRLSLIDREGVVLAPVRIEAMPDLPRVIGATANRHLGTLAGLLETVPHLRPQVTDASWIGDRRWDIRFQSGELLSLPEGAEAARRALATFARMDQQSSLLGRGFARIDMRIPDRLIVRITRQPGASVPELAPPDAGPPPENLARTI